MKNEPDIIKKLRIEEEKGLLKNDASLVFDEPDTEGNHQEDFKNFNKNYQELYSNENNSLGSEFKDISFSFKNLIDCIADPIIIVDSKGKILEMNNKITKTLGYDYNDFIGKNVFKTDLATKKTKAILVKNLVKRIAGMKIKPYEIELKASNGQFLRFEINASKIDYLNQNADLIVFREVSDLRKKLEENEKRLDTILENLQAGVAIIDPEKHEIVDINRYASNMIGLPEEKIKGNICHSFICPAQKGKCPVTNLGNTVEKSEKMLVTKEGVEKPILKTVIPINIKGKNFLLESFVDISQIKEAEQALSKSKRESEGILNAAAGGIRIINRNYTVEKVNDTLSEMIDIPAEKQIGLKCKDILKSKYCGTKECSLVKVLNDGKSFQREQKLICKNGKQIPVLLKATPVKDKNGNIKGIIEDYRDISSVKKVESNLKESEKKFRQFFESSPDYCYMVAPDGKIIDINKSAIEILDLEKKEDAIDKQIIPTIYTDPGRAKELVKKWQKQGHLSNEEIEIKSKKGKRTVLLSVDDVKDYDGKLLYSVLTQKDLTELLEKEEELKNKVDELERYKKLTVDRELKMIELKKQIKELEKKYSEEKTLG